MQTPVSGRQAGVPHSHPVAQTIRDMLGKDAIGLDILDLGCGTGLFGEEIKDIKKIFAGTDLASKMIDRAWERGHL